MRHPTIAGDALVPKMRYCTELCLDLPDDFPNLEFVEFMACVRRVLLPLGYPGRAWGELAGASNLIGWRFRATYDAWQEHRHSVASIGAGGTHEDQYRQERSLFVMFLAGTSCIESAVYALAAAASDPLVCGIPFTDKEQRACGPKRLLEWLTPHSKAGELTAALQTLVASSEWKLWVQFRNRLTHRSNLPKRIFVSTGGPAPKVNPLNYGSTSSTPEIDADFSDWDALHIWLAMQLRELLRAGTEMLRRS